MARAKNDNLKAQLLAELEENPLVSRACSKLAIHRSSFYRWCEEDKNFKSSSTKAIEKGRSKMNDFAESKLLENINNNQFQSIAFWLRNNTARYHPPSTQNNAFAQEQLKKIVWTRTEMLNLLISRLGIEWFERLAKEDYEEYLQKLDEAYEKDQIDKGYRKPGYRAFEPHLRYPDDPDFYLEDV
jgi:hypothetical protein